MKNRILEKIILWCLKKRGKPTAAILYAVMIKYTDQQLRTVLREIEKSPDSIRQIVADQLQA